jgi:hypothetical protein
MTCVENREIFFFWVVVCSLGEESWDGKEKEKIGEERVGRVVILTFANGIIDGFIMSVIPSAILTVNWSCHCMEIPV